MASTLDMGRPELEKRLLDFDRAVGFLYPDRAFRLVLVGGSALVLLGRLERGTEDVDVLDPPAELTQLMERYGLSCRVMAFEDHFAYHLEDRLVPLDVQTTSLECYSASLEDLVASKLYSQRPTDVTDVRRPEVLEALDWDLLAEVAADMEASRLNDRRYRQFLENYEAYRKEFGPCDS